MGVLISQSGLLDVCSDDSTALGCGTHDERDVFGHFVGSEDEFEFPGVGFGFSIGFLGGSWWWRFGGSGVCGIC